MNCKLKLKDVIRITFNTIYKNIYNINNSRNQINIKYWNITIH